MRTSDVLSPGGFSFNFQSCCLFPLYAFFPFSQSWGQQEYLLTLFLPVYEGIRDTAVHFYQLDVTVTKDHRQGWQLGHASWLGFLVNPLVAQLSLFEACDTNLCPFPTWG